MILAVLALLCAQQSGPPADPLPEPSPAPQRTFANELSLDVGGRLGGTVGHVLLVPYALPAPGLSAGLRWKHRFDDPFFGELELAGSAGVGSAAEVAIGYRLRGAFGGWWFDTGFVGLATSAHAGLTSLALLPLPRIGAQHALVLRPLVLEGLRWQATLKVDTDLHVVFPAVSAALATDLALTTGAFRAGIEAGLEGDVYVGWIFNSAGGGAFARLSVGVLF